MIKLVSVHWETPSVFWIIECQKWAFSMWEASAASSPACFLHHSPTQCYLHLHPDNTMFIDLHAVLEYYYTAHFIHRDISAI